MKIIHFAHCFFPVYGGTSTRLFCLLSEKSNVYDHILYVPFPKEELIASQTENLKEHEQFGNIFVHRIKTNGKDCPLFQHRMFFNKEHLTATVFTDAVIEDEVAVVHGHNPIESSFASMLYAERNKLPLIYEAHGLITDQYSPEKRKYFPGFFYFLKKKYLARYEKKMMNKAKIIIVQTQKMKNRIVEMFNIGEEKIRIISNGVLIEKFNPDKWKSQKIDLRNKKQWENRIVIMYCGFLDDINGIDFLIRAINRIPHYIKEKIKIVIAGRGPKESLVKKWCDKENDVIEFIGLLDYKAMPLYYNACDIFILPRSFSMPAETLVPMKLFEAMAMQCIILASDVGGITEIIENEVNGVIYRAGDMNDFIHKLSEIVNNPSTFRSLGKQARTDVKNKYTWEISRERLMEIYKEIDTKGEK